MEIRMGRGEVVCSNGWHSLGNMQGRIASESWQCSKVFTLSGESGVTRGRIAGGLHAGDNPHSSNQIWLIRGFYPLLAALVERWRPETHSFVLSMGEVTVTLEDVANIFGLLIDGEPVSEWTDSSSDFLQRQSIAIFGRELAVSSSSKSYIKLGWVRTIRDAEPLDTKESIKRYVRAICRASWYDTKEMDGPLNLLFVWAWERLPCIASIPKQFLPLAEIPFVMRWNHSYQNKAWLSKIVEVFRQKIDNMDEVNIYGLIIPDELHGHLEVCDIIAPLLSFECVEWHPANQVMHQFGYAQPPSGTKRNFTERALHHSSRSAAL
ncbi:hypothetical protein AHAS_Ahas13G0352100 [Arachis hypogaea]